MLNLSILDGWWDEAYQPDVGWAIGRQETYEDRAYQDAVEAENLYNLLEREVIPKCSLQPPVLMDSHVSGLLT